MGEESIGHSRGPVAGGAAHGEAPRSLPSAMSLRTERVSGNAVIERLRACGNDREADRLERHLQRMAPPAPVQAGRAGRRRMRGKI